MANEMSATTELIAAAVLTSQMGRRKKESEESDCGADCTDCPFSLTAFALALNPGEKKRKSAKV